MTRRWILCSVSIPWWASEVVGAVFETLDLEGAGFPPVRPGPRTRRLPSRQSFLPLPPEFGKPCRCRGCARSRRAMHVTTTSARRMMMDVEGQEEPLESLCREMDENSALAESDPTCGSCHSCTLPIPEMGRVRNGVYWPVHCTTFCGTVGARNTVGNLAECSNSVVLSGHGLLAGLTAAPSIPAA